MKDNFKKNGNMRVRYETDEERREILRILEEQRGFRIDEEEKQPRDTSREVIRTLDFNLKFKTINYTFPPFIGAAMMSSGCRFYSAQEFFAIARQNFRTVPRFPVFHVPHDGDQFPKELQSSVIIPKPQFKKYHNEMRDTDIIRAVPRAYRGGDMCEYFQVSRLLCDVERFIGEKEPMEQYGMGFCYEKAYDGTTIKHITPELKQKTLEYYNEHHRRMDAIASRHPRILLIDLHSYSDRIIPGQNRRPDQDQTQTQPQTQTQTQTQTLKPLPPTPDICIGTDEKYTPKELQAIAENAFQSAGYTTQVNSPYDLFYSN